MLVAAGDTELFTVRQGAGEPLLFIVGLGGRAEFWGNQFKLFAKSREVISFDHRGTGRSARYDGAYSVALMAEDTVRLMDALGLERIDIVGHSMGGAIAQHIALHHPSRVRKLVLSASWAGPEPVFLELFKLRRMVLEKIGPEAYLLQGTLLSNPGWWLQKNFGNAEQWMAERMKAFAGVAVEMGRMAAVMSHNLRDRVGSITAQTMVICARDDSITPLGLSEELATLIPGAALNVLPAGGHFCPITVTSDYNRKLARFLTSPVEVRDAA
jgi:aminoacrylate hydrolase